MVTGFLCAIQHTFFSSSRARRDWWAQHDLDRATPSGGRSDYSAAQFEILGEADAIIRQRLKDRALELPHLVLAVTPDGQVVLRNNVSPDVLRSFSEDLKNVADELTAPPEPGDATH